MEFLDGRWYLTGTAKQRVIDRTGGVIVATTTVASTSTETTIWTEALSANAMKAGRIYKLHCDGICSNESTSDDITINAYFGTAKVLTLTPSTKSFTLAEWCVDISLTVRTIGASGTYAIHGDLDIGVDNANTCALGSIDTTGANSVTVKVKWNNAKAGNTISIYQGYLELKN